jgi:hypothetical protein
MRGVLDAVRALGVAHISPVASWELGKARGGAVTFGSIGGNLTWARTSKFAKNRVRFGGK